MFFKRIDARIKVILLILILLFIFIIARVFYVQVFEYDKLSELASDLWSRELPIAADRGKILDRNGKVLADNLTTTSLVLIPNQHIGMTGVPVGTVVCYGIAAVLDVIFVRKHARMRLDFKRMFLRPLGAAAVMAVVIYGMKALFAMQLAAGGALAKIIAAAIILAAAIAYFAGLILFKVFDKEDLQLMPGGKKLEKLLKNPKFFLFF